MTGPNDPWFAKAFVNRVWAELVGEGFYEPVDDIGPDRECNAPETLDYLAKQFADHNYDVKWLYRTVMEHGCLPARQPLAASAGRNAVSGKLPAAAPRR